MRFRQELAPPAARFARRVDNAELDRLRIKRDLAQPEIVLLNAQVKKSDFELIYRLDQEHRELIECHGRERSSSEIAEKIRQVKSLSSRNRFVFVFEDISKSSDEHRRVLEADGVNCLSPDNFDRKLAQIDSVVGLLKKHSTAWNDAISSLRKKDRTDSIYGTKFQDPPYRGPS